MKVNQYLRTGILALSLTAVPLGLSVSAQTTPGQGGTDYQTGQTRTADNDTDWGWLGLLGLIGLAGLLRRREEPARTRMGDPVTSR